MSKQVVTDFGLILKNLRVNLGLTIRTVSEQIGKSTAYISNVEGGHAASPKRDTLRKWLEALHCSDRFDELNELAMLNRTYVQARLKPRDPSNPDIVTIMEKYDTGKLTDYDRQLLSCIDR